MKKHINIFVSFAIISTIIIGGVAAAQVIPISLKEKLIIQETIGSEILEEESIALETNRVNFISQDKLPDEVNDFIVKHFPAHKVIKVAQEEKLVGFYHEVHLNNNIELNFDGRNQLIQIESHNEIPKNIIPSTTQSYVDKNYPESKVLEWKMKNGVQTVTLCSEKQLMFNQNGEIMSVKSK